MLKINLFFLFLKNVSTPHMNSLGGVEFQALSNDGFRLTVALILTEQSRRDRRPFLDSFSFLS